MTRHPVMRAITYSDLIRLRPVVPHRFFLSVSPTMTDEEIYAAVLDSWIAGVLGSRGEYSGAAVQDLLDFAGYRAW